MSFPAAMNPVNSSQSTSSGPIPVPPSSGSRRKLQGALDGEAVPTGLNLRWWQRRVGERRVARGGGRNVLIVGAGPLGREMAAILKREQAGGLTVVGFLDESALGEDDVLGRAEDLAHIARVEFVDEVIVAIPDQHDAARRVVREARCNRLDIRVIPDFYDFVRGGELERSPGQLVLEYFGGLPVLTLHQEKTAASAVLWKRTLDLTLSVMALLAMAPLMAGIALAIKLTSSGQVFYRAARVGLKGRRFVCYKFRTMVANADRLKDSLREGNERQGPCFKIVDDPRITRLGRWLRRYSLDELPQFWNVLRGEMSLVGPRPHPLDDFERYRLDHLRRLDVTPGVTGLWQVTARRDPSFQRTMALDLEYIEHWSLWMDLRILWKTVFVIFQGSGS